MKDFIKAVFAGIMIGIACLISIGAGGSFPGAILFSIGLMVIVLRGYNLYTGKIGYILSVKDIPTMLLYILGNLIGVILVSLCTNISTTDIMMAKMAAPALLVFGRAVGCGFLMFLAVDIYKQHHSLLGVFGCVPAFILAGFEHSIADLFYICCSGIYDLKVLGFILIVVLGNAIGALLHKLIS